jgi:hypothetical protein
VLCGDRVVAQAPLPALDTVLDRLNDYLLTYETQLTSLVADEVYDQRHIAPRGTQIGLETTVARRRLDSEVAFMRIARDGEWYGFRDTRSVDRKAVARAGQRLADIMATPSNTVERGTAITDASSKYNLGKPRNINMPTVPLEVLDARQRDGLAFTLAGSETVRGTKTLRLAFTETRTPTIIRGPDGGDILTSGTAWVEPITGRLWRVEIICKEPGVTAGKQLSPDSSLLVEFTTDRGLGILVPIEMREVFQVTMGRGEGRATYRNFRRFQTSARIITPPPQ